MRASLLPESLDTLLPWYTVWEGQGCRNQSADGQAQLDVGGKVANKSRAKRAAKFKTIALFNSQEALSLHFSFKLGVRKGNDTGF